MNHPSREEMMEHLYGEASPARRSEIETHLQGCAPCREQVATWRGSMQALDAWPEPVNRSHHPVSRRPLVPLLRLAAAAAIVLGLGFALGRGTGLSPEQLQTAVRQEVATRLAAAMEQQRAALATELRATAGQSIHQETRRLLADFAEQLDEQRQSDAEVFYTALEQLDARRSAEVARLRRDVGTVAVVADARLSETQEQLLELMDANASATRMDPQP